MARNNRNKLLVMLGVITVCVLIIFGLWVMNQDPYSKQISFTTLYNLIKKNAITTIDIDGFSAAARGTNGFTYYTNIPNDPWWIRYMVNKNININLQNVGSNTNVDNIVSRLIQLVFSVFKTLIWVFFLYTINARSTMDRGLGEKPNVKFDDISGLKEEKILLKEVVFAMKNIERFQQYQCEPLKGVLLYGPPGNGKTMLGKAIATECDAEFFYASGADFVQIYVGAGPKRVRELFNAAREAKNSIIFIDEIDALGSRDNRGSGGASEYYSTINQLLVEMDGINNTKESNIIVILATNNPSELDPALVRKGRIDRQIEIKLPDLNDRLDLLQNATKDIALNTDVNLKTIAKGTIGFSRADLVSLVKETKMLAMRDNNYGLRMDNFENAKDQIILGTRRDIKKIKPKDLKLTSYHESGHAYMQYYYLDCVDEIYKATIIPHNEALGVVISTPDEDRVSHSRAYIEARIRILFAGRICEELFFGHAEVTSGCSSDIMKARSLAENYVRYGMADTYGLKYFNKRNYISEAENSLIYAEVSKLLSRLEEETRDIIETNKHLVDRLAKALLVAETLTGEEIVNILKGKKFLPIPTHNKKIITYKC